MNRFPTIVPLLMAGVIFAAEQPEPSVKTVVVDDAYVRGNEDGTQWTIGTRAIELVYGAKNGPFRLVNCKNLTVQPPADYIHAASAGAPFSIDSMCLTQVGNLALRRPVTASSGDNATYVTDGLARTRWQSEVGTGPQWISVDLGQERTIDRVIVEWEAARAAAYRIEVSADAKQWQEAQAVEKPPASGRLDGYGTEDDITLKPVTCRYVRIFMTKRANASWPYSIWEIAVFGPNTDVPPVGRPDAFDWTMVSAAGSRAVVGGRPVVQLDVVCARGSLKATFHVQAFPRTSIVRQWLEMENTAATPVEIDLQMPFVLNAAVTETSSFNHHRVVAPGGGGASIVTASIKPAYRMQVKSAEGHLSEYITIVSRTVGSKDGFFVANELGNSRLSVSLSKHPNGPLSVMAGNTVSAKILPGQKLRFGTVTLGVFAGDFDDLMLRTYAWQYEYQWDYTHHEWFGRMPWTTGWYLDARNLQENWAGRLKMDLEYPDYMRSTGMTLLWDDAGWATPPDIWQNTREGVDFAPTLRYLAKMDMKWLLWFGGGEPQPGVSDTKVGAWGNFQYRNDGSLEGTEQIRRFLDAHPRCSFHSCYGGSKGTHGFDLQRMTDINMLSDYVEDNSNYYWSFFELPDKWMDVLPPMRDKGVHVPSTSLRGLTMVPVWMFPATEGDQEQIRRMCQTYTFLTQEGVAGRWSFMFHPTVNGDQEFFYHQRINVDRTKSCIVIKRVPPRPVTIFPRGLRPDHPYAVSFNVASTRAQRTGADLMAKGIAIEKPMAGELIFLGLLYRPGDGTDKTSPKPPGRVLSRRECNIGHSGVGVYWSPGSDDRWIGYYEVRRGERVLGRASTGNYFFDYSADWDPAAVYAVRTVDSDGNLSDWTPAQRYVDEPLEYSAQGGLFAQAGREGWSAETTADGKTFVPMVWVPPAGPSACDLGGTINQPGGAEGYWEGSLKDGVGCWQGDAKKRWKWEGPQAARIGRGWQQAGTQVQSVRTWTAPRAGTVRLVGRAMKEYYRTKSATMRVKILRDSQPLWPADGWAEAKTGDLTGVIHDLTVPVAKGEKIRFLLDKASAPEGEILAWMPRIVYQEQTPPTNLADGSVVRIHCGADADYTDRNGNRWSADRFFKGGAPIRSAAPVTSAQPTPEDQPLYQRGRAGQDFSYAIPVPPGLYAIRLKLAETEQEWYFQRPFNLDINGRRVLTNFDIAQAARGHRKAHEKVFRYLVPDAEGRLVLRFTGGWEPTQTTAQALVQAIEVLPDIRTTIRIACGRDTDFVDWNGFVWSADRGHTGGEAAKTSSPERFVSQASPTLYDQELYKSARMGQTFRYRFAVAPGLYTVHLKFGQLWSKGPLHIAINGRRVWENFDPGAFGCGSADVRAEDFTPDKAGNITIEVTAAGGGMATLQGIEIE